MRTPISAPTMRPVLPRTNSAASGFRFCGMMELPVEKRSESAMKPNCALDQSTSSSASRERCMATSDAAASASTTKSRSETASMELAEGRSKPRSSAVMARSMGNDVPASAAAPSGDSFRRPRQSASRPRSRPIIST